MDREGAETFLRLLAEAELRDPRPPQRHAGGATDFSFFSVPATVRTLRLVPPLTRSATWIEVLAAGRSVEVRARLPVHWQ